MFGYYDGTHEYTNLKPHACLQALTITREGGVVEGSERGSTKTHRTKLTKMNVADEF